MYKNNPKKITMNNNTFSSPSFSINNNNTNKTFNTFTYKHTISQHAFNSFNNQ